MDGLRSADGRAHVNPHHVRPTVRRNSELAYFMIALMGGLVTTIAVNMVHGPWTALGVAASLCLMFWAGFNVGWREWL